MSTGDFNPGPGGSETLSVLIPAGGVIVSKKLIFSVGSDSFSYTITGAPNSFLYIGISDVSCYEVPTYCPDLYVEESVSEVVYRAECYLGGE